MTSSSEAVPRKDSVNALPFSGENVAETITHEIEGQRPQEHGSATERCGPPPTRNDPLATLAHEVAPLGKTGLRKSEKAQRRSEEHNMAHL